MTEAGTSLVWRNNASRLLYLPMIQWDLELFKMQTMKEGPLLHIAKYHVQQCLQVSQHYKQLCRNNKPRTSGTRGRCRQFCIQLLILKHSDIKSKNVVTHLASKSAISQMLCVHDQCISDTEKCMNWFRRQGEDVNFLASYIRPWSGEKKHNQIQNKQSINKNKFTCSSPLCCFCFYILQIHVCLFLTIIKHTLWHL